MKKYLFFGALLLAAMAAFWWKSNKIILFWGVAIEGFPVEKESLIKLEQETLIQPKIILFYLQWPEDPRAAPDIVPSLNTIWDQGALPCLTWEPMYMKSRDEKTIPYQHIINGSYDAYLRNMANGVKAFGKPVIIRFAHEMNLSRYHWGTDASLYGPGSREIYIRLFRYLVDFFRKEGASNGLWAFCPNAESLPSEPWNKAAGYYPGNEYVDILGMDGYNWDITEEIAAQRKLTWKKPYASFEAIFHPIYKELKSLSATKPVFVFETASVDRKKSGNGRWIREAVETAKDWDLRGIIWFQANKEEDWRMNQQGDYSYVPLLTFEQGSAQEWAIQFLSEIKAHSEK